MTVVRGAQAVAGQALRFRLAGYVGQPALVNGVAGIVSTADGQPVSVTSFTIAGGRIVAIDILVDPDRVRALDLSALGG